MNFGVTHGGLSGLSGIACLTGSAITLLAGATPLDLVRSGGAMPSGGDYQGDDYSLALSTRSRRAV